MSVRKGVLATIVDAFKSEFGSRKKHNPWPRCLACSRRTPPPLCRTCRSCDGCCIECDRCGKCSLACAGHLGVEL